MKPFYQSLPVAGSPSLVVYEQPVPGNLQPEEIGSNWLCRGTVKKQIPGRYVSYINPHVTFITEPKCRWQVMKDKYVCGVLLGNIFHIPGI